MFVIPNSNFIASSSRVPSPEEHKPADWYAPYRARLNGPSAWCAAKNTQGQWLAVSSYKLNVIIIILFPLIHIMVLNAASARSHETQDNNCMSEERDTM